MKKALIFISDYLSPDYYGASRPIIGADADFANIANLLEQKGYHCKISQTPSRQAFVNSIKRLAQESASGDNVFIYFSGHGSRRKDKSGDEPDKYDEGLCFYNGEVFDDEIGILLSEFKRDVQIVVLTDCCYSGTNLDLFSKANNIRADVIHFAAAEENQHAYTRETGSLFTEGFCLFWSSNERLNLRVFSAWSQGQFIQPVISGNFKYYTNTVLFEPNKSIKPIKPITPRKRKEKEMDRTEVQFIKEIIDKDKDNKQKRLTTITMTLTGLPAEDAANVMSMAVSVLMSKPGGGGGQ